MVLPEALQLADQWEENDVSGEEPSGDKPVGPQQALLLADQWDDNEASIVHVFHPETLAALLLAEDWTDNDDSRNEVPLPAITHLDWSYGPEHFAFLQDNMFDYSSDEDS